MSFLQWINEDLEKSCIGSALLLGNAAYILMCSKITSEDFTMRICAHTWRAMGSLVDQNLTIEVHSVVEEMRLNGVSNALEYGSEIESFGYFNGGNVEGALTQATQLARLARARRVIKCLSNSLQNAKKVANTPEQFCDVVQTNLTRALIEKQSIEVSSSEQLSEMDGVCADGLPGITTGLTALDQFTDGWRAEQLIVIAARPSMGKTAYAIHAAVASSDSDSPVLFFSLEMPKLELRERLLVKFSGLTAQQIRRPLMTIEQQIAYANALERLRKLKIHWVSRKELTLDQLRSVALQRRLRGPIKMLVVDYMQIVTTPERARQQTRELDVSAISRGLKVLGEELECPIMALAQLSRDVDKRADRRPMMSDLRESGSIEQDADVILFMYRESFYNPKCANKNELELILSKQKNGSTGILRVDFDATYGRFYDQQEQQKVSKLYDLPLKT